MATILNEKKSTGGSPYGYYTVTAVASNRTTYGVTISGTITCHLASSSSSLGTGGTMGLDAYLTLNGAEQTAVRIKATDTSWSGTGNHNTNYSFTINNLQPTQTSVPISFRVARTGSASSDTSKACSLKSTTCTPLEISQGVAQSVFNSITSPTTNGKFSMSITSYSGYDVLTITNGSTFTKTIGGVANNVEYDFTAEEQTALNGLFASNSSTINLTATLETFTANGGTSLGSTSKTMEVYLPDYTPTVTPSASADAITTYDRFKQYPSDLIKGLSKLELHVIMSNNYGNTYTSATCNGVAGTIRGYGATFNALDQADSYAISVTDSRGKTGTFTLDGSQYGSGVSTVQWYKGSLETTVERPSPTGNTAIVTTTVNVYDGTNLKSSALLSEDFTFTYTEAGGTPQTKYKSDFSYADGKYTCTLTGLTPTKTVSWSISGTDKIGVATNGDSDTLKIGMPVWNAYKDNSGNQTFKVNGNTEFGGDIHTDGAINQTNPSTRVGSNIVLRGTTTYPEASINVANPDGSHSYIVGYGVGGGDNFAMYSTETIRVISTIDREGRLTASGEVRGGLNNGYGQFRAAEGNYGFLIRNDGGYTYFMLTNSGDAYGSWNNLRPITIENANGNVIFNEPTTFNSENGNIAKWGSYDENSGITLDQLGDNYAAGFYCINTNGPEGNGWYYVMQNTLNRSDTNWRYQEVVLIWTYPMKKFVRCKIANVWQAWQQVW